MNILEKIFFTALIIVLIIAIYNMFALIVGLPVIHIPGTPL